MDGTEVEEGAGEDAPPLALCDGKGVDQVLLADRADGAAEQAALQRGASAQDRIDPEQADAEADDPDRDVAGVGRVGAPRAVELAASGKVVPGLLEQPRDPVGDRPAFGGWRAPVGLSVGGDRLLEVAVANVLLGGAAPAEPRARAAGIGGLGPRDQRPWLVVGPVARGPDQEPRLAGNLALGIAGQWLEEPDRGLGVAGVEQPATLLEGRQRIGRSSAVDYGAQANDRRELAPRRSFASPPGRGRHPVEPGA